MELGKKIASLRKQNKITQAKLAEYLAVMPQTISRWEADGGTPDVMLLPKIATFFNDTTKRNLALITRVWYNKIVKYSHLNLLGEKPCFFLKTFEK